MNTIPGRIEGLRGIYTAIGTQIFVFHVRGWIPIGGVVANPKAMCNGDVSFCFSVECVASSSADVCVCVLVTLLTTILTSGTPRLR